MSEVLTGKKTIANCQFYKLFDMTVEQEKTIFFFSVKKYRLNRVIGFVNEY